MVATKLKSGKMGKRGVMPSAVWASLHELTVQVWLLYDHSQMNRRKIQLEYWQSQEGPRRALHKFAGAMLKFF